MKTFSQFYILPNGMGLLCERVSAPIGYFGVAINAGSRDEAPDRFGLAHFVEHTIFKGTTHRRACHIINRMDSIGGELNAFTTKEETDVYSVFPGATPRRAVELIADLLLNSVFPAEELNKEREVVREEIDSYLDSPSESIFDDFENLFFAGSGLGHNILGNPQNLQSFTSDVCRHYIHCNYTPDRMVAYYRGSFNPERVRDMVASYFSPLNSAPSALHRGAPTAVAPFHVERKIDSHQVHCVMGLPLPSIFSPERHAIGLLTNIIGGPAMNSRLNVALRERRGLVYTVEANSTLMSDCGLFTVYFGCDSTDVGVCRELVCDQLNRISSEMLSPRALASAKKQYLGQIVVARDNSEHMALNGLRTALYFREEPDFKRVCSQINECSASDLLSAARYFDPAKISSLTFF